MVLQLLWGEKKNLPLNESEFNRDLLDTVVVGQGLWRAPGDCNDVSNALSQALKNRCER
jgi:hypothetical protein